MKKLVTIITAAFIMFSVSGVQAGMETVITPSISYPGDEFGISVDMTEDAAIVGTRTENGAAFVYEKEKTGWTEKAVLTVSDNASNFGAIVAISQTFAVTANYNEDIYVFQKPNKGWSDMNESEKISLSRPGYEGITIYGIAVYDQTIAVCFSTKYQDKIIRPVNIYNYSGGKLVLEDTIINENFGHCIDIYENNLIIGSSSSGALIYKKEKKNWVFSARLTANDMDSTKYFGWEAAINDGLAIVGDPGTSSVYIFEYDGNAWIQKQKEELNSFNRVPFYGHTVDINNDYAVLSRLSLYGTVLLYKRNSATDLYEKIEEHQSASMQHYFWPAALTETDLIIGHPEDRTNGNEGSALIYNLLITGDIDNDGDVDNDDIAIIRIYLNKPAVKCPECDINEDGKINILDIRKLIMMCTYPGCECR